MAYAAPTASRRIRFQRFDVLRPNIKKTIRIFFKKGLRKRILFAIKRGKKPIIKIRVAATDGYGADFEYDKIRITR